MFNINIKSMGTLRLRNYEEITSARRLDNVKRTATAIVILKRIFSAPRLVYIEVLSDPPKALPRLASLLWRRISMVTRTDNPI